MKKILLSFLTITAFSLGANAQIFDAPVSATQTNINNGQNTTIYTTGSHNGVQYSLRNNSNTVIAGPTNGNGTNINFSTGTLTATDTFNIFAETTVDNGSLDFDGSNGFINLGDNIEGFGAVTFEAWIYWQDGNSDYHIIMAKELVFALAISNTSKLHLNFGNGTTWGTAVNSNLSVPVNQWVHVAGTRNSTGSVKVYINGTLRATGSNTNLGTNSNENIIGAKAFGAGFVQHFNGKIDEVSVWDHDRTAVQIQGDMTCLTNTAITETGLLNYYTLNHNDGVIAADVVAGIDGTLTNMFPTTDWSTVSHSTCSANELELSQTVIVSVNPVGVNEHSTNNKIAVYPNPATSQITLNTTEQIEFVSILDVTGKTVKTISYSSNIIDLTELVSGIYFLQVQTENGVGNSKFIKE